MTRTQNVHGNNQSINQSEFAPTSIIMMFNEVGLDRNRNCWVSTEQSKFVSSEGV